MKMLSSGIKVVYYIKYLAKILFNYLNIRKRDL